MMAEIPPRTEQAIRRPEHLQKSQLRLLTAPLLLALLAGLWSPGLTAGEGFAEVFVLLSAQCGECHVTGKADGPWSVDAAADPQRFPECAGLDLSQQARCTTFHQLIDPPGPGIPAWIDQQQGDDNPIYLQACNPSASFHLGHSLPAQPDLALCGSLQKWLDAGLLP